MTNLHSHLYYVAYIESIVIVKKSMLSLQWKYIIFVCSSPELKIVVLTNACLYLCCCRCYRCVDPGQFYFVKTVQKHVV